MAKLADLQQWLEGVEGGNAPRAYSLVKLARGAGLFTTGGRGRGAPEMTPNDFANIVLLALSDATPNDAPERVKALGDLPLHIFAFDPEGNDIEVEGHHVDEHYRDMLPGFMSAAPKTAREYLTAFFTAAAEGKVELCRFTWWTLKDGVHETTLEIEAHDPDYRGAQSGETWAEGPGHIGRRFGFSAFKFETVPLQKTTTAQLHSRAIEALVRMAGGADG